ncbi:MAG: MFS transporter [Candidatus Helarchaeota archaeon]|nr:MFS transporter [Candidatus Helarchaeota archaeon]
MIIITKNRSYRYLLYISNYLVQGIATLMIFTLLPIYLKNYKGLTDFSIAMIASLTFFPIILKPFIAIISDKYPFKVLGGRRKPYILIGFIMNGISLSFFGMTNPVEFIYIFIILGILQSLGISLMDVALDALVIENFPDKKEKLNANIIFHLTIISSVFIVLPLAFISERESVHIGINLTYQFEFDIFFGGNFEFGFLLAGLICIGLIIFSIFLKESEKISSTQRFSIKDLRQYTKSEHVPTLLLIFFITQIDTGLTDFTLDPFFRILGLTSGVQLISVSPMMIFIFLGGLASRWFIKKGIIKTILVVSVVHTTFYGVLSYLTFTNSLFIPLFYFSSGILVSFSTSCATVLFLTLAMDSSDKKLAATTFVLFITMGNLGRIFGIILAGLLPFNIYPKMGIIFLISCIIMASRIPLLIKIRRIENQTNF